MVSLFVVLDVLVQNVLFYFTLIFQGKMIHVDVWHGFHCLKFSCWHTTMTQVLMFAHARVNKSVFLWLQHVGHRNVPSAMQMWFQQTWTDSGFQGGSEPGISLWWVTHSTSRWPREAKARSGTWLMALRARLRACNSVRALRAMTGTSVKTFSSNHRWHRDDRSLKEAAGRWDRKLASRRLAGEAKHVSFVLAAVFFSCC